MIAPVLQAVSPLTADNYRKHGKKASDVLASAAAKRCWPLDVL